MARVGRFGNLPAKAPDLSATIVAMLEAYENQRDRNIQTAWEQGGQFEGGKVTDEKYLAFIRDRMQSVSRDDPMYDYWQQTFFSVRFQIAESKANLQYQRENWDEWDMARFYREQAQRVPRHSEAWRDLMTNAAQFAKAAKAQRAASSAEAKRRAFEHNWNQIKRRYVDPAGYVDEAMSTVARREGWITEAQTWRDLDFDNVLTFDGLLAHVENSPDWTEIRAYLNQHDPNFHGRLTMDYVHGSWDRAEEGARRWIGLAKKNGYKSEADAARKARKDFHDRGSDTQTYDIGVEYAKAYQAYVDSGGEDPMATDAEQAAARADYVTALARLERKADRVNDVGTAGRLRNEQRMLVGDTEGVGPLPLIREDFIDPGGTSTFARTEADRIKLSNEHLESLAKGESVQVVTPDGGSAGTPQIVPASEAEAIFGPQGSAVLVRSTVPSTARGPDGQVVTVPATTYVEHRRRVPLVVSVVDPKLFDPRTGFPTTDQRLPYDTTQGDQVGWVIIEDDGSKTYATYTSDGTLAYSKRSPFQHGAVQSEQMQNGTWTVLANPDFVNTGGVDQGGVLKTIFRGVDDPNTPDVDERTEGLGADPRALLRDEYTRGERVQPEPEEVEPVSPEAQEEMGQRTDDHLRWQSEYDRLEAEVAKWQARKVDPNIQPDPMTDTMLADAKDRLAQMKTSEPPRYGPTNRQAEIERLRETMDRWNQREPTSMLERIDKENVLRETAAKLREVSGGLPENERLGEELRTRSQTGEGIAIGGGFAAPIPRGLADVFTDRARRMNLTKALLGVTSPGDPPPETPPINEPIGPATYTTMVYSQDQIKRREMLGMDPLAVVQMVWQTDPDARTAGIDRVSREINGIREGANMTEAEFVRGVISNMPRPGGIGLPQETLDKVASRAASLVPGGMVRSVMTSLGIPVREPTASEDEREAALMRGDITGYFATQPRAAVAPAAGGRAELAPATQPETKVPALPPAPPVVTGTSAGVAREVARQRTEIVPSVTRQVPARRLVKPSLSVARQIPVLKVPKVQVETEPRVSVSPEVRAQVRRRREEVYGSGGTTKARTGGGYVPS